MLSSHVLACHMQEQEQEHKDRISADQLHGPNWADQLHEGL